ncbi:MAG: tripartite tricarboxylate transporter TctB family protein [Candidatus Limnocylindria bacterium]|nr:tripartite tricarboxylate transporter TctB family protein [Candidatus Limnocylindria bacterium]
MRPYQVGTAAAIVMIAAVAMYDSRNVFVMLPGTAPGDIGPSWYPFWAAALMGAAALLVAYRSRLIPQSKEGVFETRESVTSVLKLVIPMFVYALSFRWLGFYLATIVYMGFFAAYLGRYRWWGIAAAALLTPLAIYLLFEVAFRLILPRSIFYTMGFPL